MYLGLPKDLPQNYIFEYSYGQKCIINDISRVLNKSCFVIFDYGYAASELYLKDRMLGTLTCIKNHITDFNPLSDVGMKDVSAFVNFTYINNVFTSNSWETEAFMNQANYLLSFDILNDIDISNHDEMNDIKKLIMPNLMGELFKVLVMKKNMHKTDKNYFMKNDIIKL